MSQQETALYRVFNSEGHLLYAGISLHPLTRMTQHKKGKNWRPTVIRLEWFVTRAVALAAETRAIVTEKPALNIIRPVAGPKMFICYPRNHPTWRAERLRRGV